MALNTEKPTNEADRDRSKLPLPELPFRGKIGKTYLESEMDWPRVPAPPAGAPNVVVILLDDVGFGQVSTFGGPVPTPALDKLAAGGLRYNRFHTTSICGPSRAAMLTGRNHHNCGSGFLVEWATSLPSYNCMIPKTTATIGEMLKGNGYTLLGSARTMTRRTGRPASQVLSTAGRQDWDSTTSTVLSLARRIDTYPVIFENTVAVEPDKTPEEGYHFMTDMTDKAIHWLRFNKSVAPQKPFFMYFAPGAAHAPHHSPRAWREKFKGMFDVGWDAVREATYKRQLDLGIIPPDTVLTPRPEWVKPWDSLSGDERRLFAAFMENFAGYLAFADNECGRVLDAVRQLPDADNTLIFFIVGDNGASSEGGFRGRLTR